MNNINTQICTVMAMKRKTVCCSAVRYGLPIHLQVLAFMLILLLVVRTKNGIVLWNCLPLPSAEQDVCNDNTGY